MGIGFAREPEAPGIGVRKDGDEAGSDGKKLEKLRGTDGALSHIIACAGGVTVQTFQIAPGE